jgi:hypothetical protein
VGQHERPLTRYVVELRRPALGWQDIHLLGNGLRAAAQELRSHGTAVRFLRTVHVPEDDSCFLLFEARSVVDVKEAVRRATPAVKRVAEVIRPGE